MKPIQTENLEPIIRERRLPLRQTSEAGILSEEVRQIRGDEFFVFASPIMRKLMAQADLLSQTNAPLLILGEPGTGKATVARLIHDLSVRSGFRFAQVNCGALPEDLLDHELFGSHHNGVADTFSAKPGVLELCEKGTVLLEDVTELPPVTQAKLFDVLQSKRSPGAGSQMPLPLDVRILATISGNLEHALLEKKLREDLYYHLSAFTIQVPPLRQRKEAIPLLLHHFMLRLAKHYGLPAQPFSEATLEACQAYSWPGNLKELEDFAKRCLVLGDKDPGLGYLKPGWNGDVAVEPILAEPSAQAQHSESAKALSLKSLVQTVKWEAERNAIVGALEKTGWNRKAAARLLRVSYRTMLYKIEQYRMSSPEHPGTHWLKNGTNGGNGSKENPTGH
ncbi:MAG TPA: sigma 54-interacting transcriptional regulator [Terriglobales bacterium]